MLSVLPGGPCFERDRAQIHGATDTQDHVLWDDLAGDHVIKDPAGDAETITAPSSAVEQGLRCRYTRLSGHSAFRHVTRLFAASQKRSRAELQNLVQKISAGRREPTADR
jgi:hypothetical protein